ncbi:hypothetical protein PUN28_000681 [Cardiocondyla obscurior]|uniref:Uncharacterized protein n=1 Tax=Cardiocondyla obscurior TaxID=286306 RepID=A0AAW2H0Y1_9HYME
MGGDAAAAESLYRKNQPQWKLKPQRSLTHHAHSHENPEEDFHRRSTRLTSPLEWPVLRGGAGSGRASCIGGATFSHRQIFSTPLKFMQIGK